MARAVTKLSNERLILELRNRIGISPPLNQLIDDLDGRLNQTEKVIRDFLKGSLTAREIDLLINIINQKERS